MRLMSDNTVMLVTPEAIENIIKLRDQEPGEGEFGLALKVSGMQGLQYTYDLTFSLVDDLKSDWVLERHGGLAVMFPEADTSKLQGAALEMSEQGLSMNNPNVPASPSIEPPPGNLEGPLVERIKQVLAENINPAIAAHGGAAELLSVDGTTAYMQLQGGCVGCGMAQVTLKQGIERMLLDVIPELTEVVDATDHSTGTNPYYQSSKK